MKQVLLTAMALLMGLAVLAAHQDTIIQFKDGKLDGLPEEFQPSAFDLDKKILTISGKELPFPEALRALFPDQRSIDEFGEPIPVKGIPFELKFSASWYHEPSLLPPYLLIKIMPKDRDFSYEILVDIKSVAFLEAHVLLKISDGRTDLLPILIDKPAAPERGPDDWLPMIGMWRSGTTIIEITKNRIQATESGEAVDYPKGEIAPKGPGVMSLKLPEGDEETFNYEQDGDTLILSFQRAGSIGLSRLGSAADKACQRRNIELEKEGAEVPATHPESR